MKRLIPFILIAEFVRAKEYVGDPGKVLKKDPIGAQSTFEHISARAIGDINALSPEQVERTKSQPLPFPGDAEMVMRCSESLKMAIRGAITNNRRLII